MRWLISEYLLKGIFLGLLLFAAVVGPTLHGAAIVGGCLLAGLVGGLAVAAVQKIRPGYRTGGRVASFILLLLLDHPTLVYGGVILGLFAGALAVRPDDVEPWLMPAMIGGGALV